MSSGQAEFGPVWGSGRGFPFPDRCPLGRRPEPRCQGWPKATPQGLGLDGGEDDVTLCGGRGDGKDRGVEAEVSVSLHDAWSRLICAGWLPQDRVFGWSVARV